MKHKNFIITMIITAIITFISGKEFLNLRSLDKVTKGEGVLEVEMLSDYSPALKGTVGDTEIYHLKGKEEGGSLLVLGGTHPNEPSSFLTAAMIVESLKVEKGDVYVITRANRSAFTHNDAQEGNMTHYHIKTQSGDRAFRFGSRATNPAHQWPDPDVYVHSSGQKLSGGETRNLNRAYPGKKDGTLTEKVAYGIINLINTKKIDASIDLHEASPEYPVINAMVAPEKSVVIASGALMNLQLDGVEMGIEPSPKNLHGLSHREWADFTNTLPFLMETANPAQGRLRGPTTEATIVEGKDPFYPKLAEIDMLFVPFTEEGHHINTRVARHMSGIKAIMDSYSEFYPENSMGFENCPSYDEIVEKGIGAYLK